VEATAALSLELSKATSNEDRDRVANVIKAVWPSGRDVNRLIDQWMNEHEASSEHQAVVEAFLVAGVVVQQRMETWALALRNSNDSHIRVCVIRGLGRTGTNDAKVIENIGWVLVNDGYNPVKLEAAIFLKNLGPLAKQVGDQLVQALGDRDLQISDTAADALVGLGKDALPFLLAASKSTNGRVRSCAETVLQRVKKDTPLKQ
jgi:hypothetical protein